MYSTGAASVGGRDTETRVAGYAFGVTLTELRFLGFVTTREVIVTEVRTSVKSGSQVFGGDRWQARTYIDSDL